MDFGSNFIDSIFESSEVTQLQWEIQHHPAFKNMKSQLHLRIFMEHHVFQVWDFMILLKSIQFGINNIYKQGYNNFSCWFPKVPGKFSRLITEICLDEESDEALWDLSHFEYYLKAMEQSNCEMYHIERALQYVRSNTGENQNLENVDFFPSEAVEEHFRYMRNISNITENPEALLYKPLASFCVCREGLIPDFFSSIVKEISQKSQISNNYFIQYLTRHIELDGDEHSEKWYELLGYFLDDDNFDDALEIIIQSLRLRKQVLDEINEKILLS